jgi:hypothetical protein
MENKIKYVWVIAYIDRDHLLTLDKDFKKYGFDCKACVPTIKVLRKKFKNQSFFDYIPFLFNYGFIKMTLSMACSRDMLDRAKECIPGIYSWLLDFSKKDTREITYSKVHIVRYAEIYRLVKLSETYSIFDSESLTSVKEGDTIILKGYPFENLPAEVLEINHKKKDVRVLLSFGDITKEVVVAFENVFYSVYMAYDEDKLLSDNTLEAFNLISKVKVDKIYLKLQPNEN